MKAQIHGISRRASVQSLQDESSQLAGARAFIALRRDGDALQKFIRYPRAPLFNVHATSGTRHKRSFPVIVSSILITIIIIIINFVSHHHHEAFLPTGTFHYAGVSGAARRGIARRVPLES
jgi:hypothetical protein